jgi:hypothetical protein
MSRKRVGMELVSIEKSRERKIVMVVGVFVLEGQ